MVAPHEIVRLFEQIRDVTSPVERVKLLARGWKSLRRMDRSQLRLLASQLGFDGAEDLLSRLARGRGIDVRLISKALHQARDADPQEVREFVRALGDPEQQARLLRQGAELVADQVEDEVEPEPEPVQEEAEPPTKLESARPPKQPVPVEPPKPVVRPAVPPATPDPGARSVPTARKERTIERRGDSGALVESVRQERSPIRRLRRLRGGIESLIGEKVETIRDLLACFPAGWQRRRALTLLLRRRIPADLHRAIFLIEWLDDAAGERWCASALLDAWDLEPDQREAIAARHRVRLRGRTVGPRAATSSG